MKNTVFFLICLLFCTTVLSAKPDKVLAFPDAKGFGSYATGGRGGKVIYVTNLNINGPGSLEQALADPDPAYVLFKVSGVIPNRVLYKKGNKTIAGQTSPGGVIVKGGILFAYEENDSSHTINYNTNNSIIRHIKSRDGGDALRIIKCRDVIVDHCSFAWADDECLQLSNSVNVTVQNCIMAETYGKHVRYGGTLIVYGTEKYPLDSISYLRNLFMRIGGRLPEFNCYMDEWCDEQNFDVEWANNLYWDPGAPMEFKYTGGTADLPGGKVFFSFDLNLVNNYYRVRSTYNESMIGTLLLENEKSNLFISGNEMSKWPGFKDYDILNCCIDFKPPSNAINKIKASRKTSPHFYISTHHDSCLLSVDTLRNYMIKNVGSRPFHRDSIDRRYIGYLARDTVDTTIKREDSNLFGDALLFDWVLKGQTTPMPKPDKDNDGMPDDWERWNGLDTNIQDHNGFDLSNLYTGCDSCYTNLEVYLNQLADSLTVGVALTKGKYLGNRYRYLNRVIGIKNNKNSFKMIENNNTRVHIFNLKGQKIIEAANLAELNRKIKKGTFIGITSTEGKVVKKIYSK